MRNLIRKDLRWRHLKALNQIYEKGFTENKIQSHPYVKFLLKEGILRKEIGRPQRLVSGVGFEKEYETEFLVNFRHYRSFLEENTNLKIQANFSEEDIKRLMFVKQQKDRILSDHYSRRKFSTVFFREGSKYLDDHPGLEKAVLDILGLDKFPGKDPKDQQYRFVVDCQNPQAIVLCENINFLTMPWVSRAHSIELWYAGGNNVEKLNHLPPIVHPVFYSCDWDYDGLRIFARIKQIIPEIRLLFPSALNARKSVYSYKHKSYWNQDEELSGLPKIFSDEEVDLITSLIGTEEWIEEEANDLIKMLDAATRR